MFPCLSNQAMRSGHKSKNAETRMNTGFQHKQRRYEIWTFQNECSGLIPSFTTAGLAGMAGDPEPLPAARLCETAPGVSVAVFCADSLRLSRQSGRFGSLSSEPQPKKEPPPVGEDYFCVTTQNWATRKKVVTPRRRCVRACKQTAVASVPFCGEEERRRERAGDF